MDPALLVATRPVHHMGRGARKRRRRASWVYATGARNRCECDGAPWLREGQIVSGDGSDPNALPPALPAGFPRPFGPYLLLSSYGRGGMGEVFLAQRTVHAGVEDREEL